MKGTPFGIFLAGLLALALSSCGPAAPIEVDVRLTEFTVTSSETLFKVGQPYVFTITNDGTVNHEFTIGHPVEAGGEDMHDMSESLVEVLEDKLPPGATVTVEYTFTEPADYATLEIACHVEGHYEGGMILPITVE